MAVNLDPQLFQLLGDDTRPPMRFQTEFGAPMEVAPEGVEFVSPGSDGVDRIHLSASLCSSGPNEAHLNRLEDWVSIPASAARRHNSAPLARGPVKPDRANPW